MASAEVQRILGLLDSGSRETDKLIGLQDVATGDVEMDTGIAERVLNMVSATVRGGKKPSSMNPLLRSLLKAVVTLNANPHVRRKYIQESLLLEQLNIWYSRLLETCDRQLILSTIEVLGKDSSGRLWKPASMKSYVQMCFDIILNDMDENCFIHAVKILIYLCKDSSSVYLVARGAEEFKDVWVYLSNLVFETPATEHSRKRIVVVHLMFLLENGFNSRLLDWGLQYAIKYTQKLFQTMIEPDGPDAMQTSDGGISRFAELVGLLDMLVGQVKVKLDICKMPHDFRDCDEDISREVLGQGMKMQNLLINLSINIAPELSGSIPQFNHPEQLVSAAELITVLTPSFIHPFELKVSYCNAFEAMDEFMLRPQTLITKSQAFGTFLHLISNIVELGPECVNKYEKDLLKAVKYVKLSPTSNWEELDIHITYCRILSVISRVPFLAMEVKRILDVNTLEQLVSSFFIKIPKEHQENDLKATTFVIETLGVITDNSHHAISLLNLVMKLTTIEGTAFHIAAGILSGNEHLVRKALTITGSVSFSRDSLNAVAKIVSNMRAGVGPIIPPRFNLSRLTYSPLAARGLIKIEESLEAVGRSCKNANGTCPTLISEIMSLHQFKTSILESDMLVLREKLQETGDVMAQLHKLTGKQSELMAKQLSSSELKDQQVLMLSHELEVAKQELLGRKASLEKELTIITSRLNFNHQKLVTCEASLETETKRSEKLLKETTKIKAQFAQAEASRKDTQGKLDKLVLESANSQKILTEQKKKILALEKEVRIKEEERKRFEMLLENERRTLDTIRGVVGNNMRNAIANDN